MNYRPTAGSCWIMEPLHDRKRNILAVVSSFAILIPSGVILYSFWKNNHVLLYNSMEICCGIISICIFLLTNIYADKEKNVYSLLGSGYLIAGILDFLYTLSDRNINGIGIYASFAEAVSILFFLVYMKRSIRFFKATGTVYLFCLTAAAAALIYAQFNTDIFTNRGALYPAEKMAGYTVCILFAIALLLIKFKSPVTGRKLSFWFSLSLSTAVFSELCFILYKDPSGITAKAGFLLKILSLYFMYKSVFIENIQSPKAAALRELNNKIEEIRLLNEKLGECERAHKSISRELDMIIDNIPGLVFYKDRHNRYTKVNKYLTDIYKKTKQELEGKSLFALYSRSDAENYYEDDLQVINSGTAKLNIEERWMTKTGPRWINVNKIPFVNADGEIQGVIGLAMDITDKKKYEEKILKLLAELEIEKTAALKSSFTDGLTGIYNRRYFNEVLSRAIAAARRKKHMLSIVMIDIDYFKNYNDLFGHVAGDECLKKVAGALQAAACRATDTLARYGGEEFAVILEDTDKKGALILARKMKRAVYSLHLRHPKSRCSTFVTISIGVTTVTDAIAGKEEDLINLADTALYKAKENGRNRIEFSRPESVIDIHRPGKTVTP